MVQHLDPQVFFSIGGEISKGNSKSHTSTTSRKSETQHGTAADLETLSTLRSKTANVEESYSCKVENMYVSAVAIGKCTEEFSFDVFVNDDKRPVSKTKKKLKDYIDVDKTHKNVKVQGKYKWTTRGTKIAYTS